MKCDICKENDALYYFEQNINGQRQVIHLCENCAKAYQADLMNMSINEVFQNFMNGFKSNTSANAPNYTVIEKKCGNCGLTYSQFKKNTKLGCSECYNTFAKELDNIYDHIQPGRKHIGKIPKRAGVEQRRTREIDRLREDLKSAVISEEYEKAAAIRDTIKEIETRAVK